MIKDIPLIYASRKSSGQVCSGIFSAAGRNSIAGFAAMLFCSEILPTSYGEIYGAHARATGMGNAVTAVVNDSSAVFYNPAGLGRNNFVQEYMNSQKERPVPIMPFITTEDSLKKKKKGKTEEKTPDPVPVKTGEMTEAPAKKGFLNELHLQGHLTQPLLKSNGGQSEDVKNVKDSYGGLGLSIDLNNFIKLKRNIRFGLNLILPATGNLLAINDVNPSSPRYLQAGRSLERPTIMGGIGAELWKDRLYAGIGFTALVRGRGSALLKNVQISPDQTVPNQQVIVDVKPAVNPTFGMMFQWKDFYAGVSYKREIMTSVDPVNARAQTAILAIQLDVKLALFDHFTPRTWNYGIGYRFKEKFLFTADLNRELWSAFRFSSVKNEYSQPIFFRDISNPRAGFEYTFRDNILFRAGYGKRMNPAGRMPGEANIIDFERRIGSIGASYAFFPALDSMINTPVILDLVYEYHSLKSEVQNKYLHSWDSSNYAAKGKIHHFGFSVTAYF